MLQHTKSIDINLFLKILFEREHERERERVRTNGGGVEREAESLLSGSPTWDLIPGPWDHDLKLKADT